MLNEIKVSRPRFSLEAYTGIVKILDSGILSNGEHIKTFEENFRKYIGSNQCIATANGTSALHTILLSLGIKQGDLVAVPSYTFFATVEAVLQCGAKPVFIDIDRFTWNMDPKELEKFIEGEDTKVTKLKAVIAVHLFGNPANVLKLVKLCKFYNTPLIEDCAQAHGATVESQKVGSFGDFGAWSFFSTKNLSAGEGGAITSNMHIRTKNIRKIINHGMSDRHTHEILGYNYRMSEIEACIANTQLKSLEENNNKRIKNSNYLIGKLINEEWLVPQQLENVASKHVYFTCPFWINESKAEHGIESIIKKLAYHKIEVRHRYLEPIFLQPVMKKYPHFVSGDQTNSKTIVGKVIGLPNHPGLTKKDLDRIVKAVLHVP